MTVRIISGAEADAFDTDQSAQQSLARQYCLLVVYLRRVSNTLRDGAPARLAGLRRMLQVLADASDG